MRPNKKVMLAAAFLAIAVGGGGLPGNGSIDALTPWPDRVLAMASMRIDYTVPLNAAVSVTQESVIRTTKSHTGAPASAVVHSARLGFLNDPGVHNLLVWVVDGIRHEQVAGPLPIRVSSSSAGC